MKPIIRVENLSKQYRIGAQRLPYRTLRETLTTAARKPLNWFNGNGHSEENTIWALRDVSFEVMPGEVVGVIGRNGAGKSTLLKLLSRITEPTTGRIDLYGRVGSLLEVGTGFHAELTGRENIYLNGAILGMNRSEISQKLDEIIAFAEIEKFIDTPVKHYSSGMYMRLAFAVAAHLEPEVLVIDEVLAVGDSEFQKKCLGKMDDIAKQGRTVLFVSHNMAAVQSLCVSGILLSSGKISNADSIQKVVREYLADQNTSDGSAILSSCARSGNGQGRITDVKISNPDTSDGQPSSGCRLKFEFTILNTTKQTLGNFDLGFSLHDKYQSGLGLLYSSYTGSFLDLHPGQNKIEFVMTTPLLVVGNYYLGCRLVRRSVEVDYPKALIPFDVKEADYYGSANTAWLEWGSQILIDGQWRN